MLDSDRKIDRPDRALSFAPAGAERIAGCVDKQTERRAVGEIGPYPVDEHRHFVAHAED